LDKKGCISNGHYGKTSLPNPCLLRDIIDMVYDAPYVTVHTIKGIGY
jgi:hypothetical protein